MLIAVRVHPFPSRTRKLSSPAPKILVWRRTGKIGQRQHKSPKAISGSKYSSLAQSVEHAAVNRRVVGSSPTGGAKKTPYSKGLFVYNYNTTRKTGGYLFIKLLIYSTVVLETFLINFCFSIDLFSDNSESLLNLSGREFFRIRYLDCISRNSLN